MRMIKSAALYMVAFVFCCQFSVIGQSDLLGTWMGQMQTNDGRIYSFRLEIKNRTKAPQRDLSFSKGCHLYAVASHDRMIERKSFELQGQQFRDQSVYLYEFPKDRKLANQGDGEFNRMEFEFVNENGIPTLIGHWQEYQTIRKYRKGRLVLTKLKVGT